MFKAYFDASGSPHDQPLLVVAGFVGHTDSWRDWERDWLARLKEDKLEYFHRNELGGMDPLKRNRLIEDLAWITKAHVACKVGCAVINETLNTLLSDEDRERWSIQSYTLAGRNVAKEVRIWAGEWGGRMPELVFEKGDKGEGDLRELLILHRYPEPIFRRKKRYVNPKSRIPEEPVLPLQAADLLAYEMFNMIRGVHLGKSRIKPREVIRFKHEALEKIPGMCGIVTADHLRFLKQGMDELESPIMVPQVKINVRN